MKYYVYILYSDRLNRYYIGQTKNIETRLKQHNKGQEKYTGKGIPWILIWFTDKSTRSESVILERKLKNLNRERLERFIEKYKEQKADQF